MANLPLLKVHQGAKVIKLSRKLTLVVEENSAALSAAVGIFVDCGSRSEPLHLQGVTHIAEHVFFKGTSQRSAEEISQTLERYGGDLNAYTDRELTVFHAWVPFDRCFEAADLLIELLLDSRFDADEFEKEKQVVVQELKGYAEDPEEEFWDGLIESQFGQHPVGRRIGGFPEKVSQISFPEVMRYIREDFLASSWTLAVVSPFSAERVEREIRNILKKSGSYLWADSLRKSSPARKGSAKGNNFRIPKLPKDVSKSSKHVRFESEQVHVGFSYPAAAATDPNEILWNAFIALAGVGSSSKLYSELRERRALAYNTSMSLLNFSDAGLAVGYLATDKSRMFEALSVAGQVMRDFASRGIGDSELDFVHGMIEGSIYLGYEGVQGRMDTLGRQYQCFQRVFSLQDMLAELRLLNKKALTKIAKNFSRTPSIYALGPLTKNDFTKLVKAWETEL